MWITAVKLMGCKTDMGLQSKARQVLDATLIAAINVVTKPMAGRTRAAFRAAFHYQSEYALLNIGIAEDKTTSGQIQQLAHHHRKHLEMQATEPPSLDASRFPNMFLHELYT